LDLVAPEATHDTPAATRRETSKLAFGHFSQNSQFRRLRNEVLRFGRERFGDLCGQGWQVLPHKKVIELTVDPAMRGRGDPSWLIEKVFAAVASLCGLIFARGRGALCGSEGPRAVGFSMLGRISRRAKHYRGLRGFHG
jgi:hypothetical protein